MCVPCVCRMVCHESRISCMCGGWNVWDSHVYLLDVGDVTHVVVCVNLLFKVHAACVRWADVRQYVCITCVLDCTYGTVICISWVCVCVLGGEM